MHHLYLLTINSLSLSLSLSLSTQLLSSIPEVDFQCSGSELHFMLCVDSCSLLRDLILYISENRDLSTTQQHTTIQYNTINSQPINKTVSTFPHCRNMLSYSCRMIQRILLKQRVLET